MPKHPLEAQLLALTQEFVAKLVDTIRNASFGDVASLPGRQRAAAIREDAAPRTAVPTARRGRQTAVRRAEMGERLLEVLRASREPMGVRALAEELGVGADVLAAPLRELRAGSKVRKHGEKRATTYSAA